LVSQLKTAAFGSFGTLYTVIFFQPIVAKLGPCTGQVSKIAFI
jgi:hypothetical protein